MAKGKGWFSAEIQISGRSPDLRRSMPQLVVAAAEMAKSEWSRIASQSLHSTANEYMRALKTEHSANRSVVKLSGDTWLPNVIESGANPYDLKIGLLQSPKAKWSRDEKGRFRGGKYITVPLSLKAPGSGERGPSPPVMPWSVYKIVSKGAMGTTTKLPLRLENLGKRSRLSPDPSRWSPYTWKTSPFQGIRRSPDPARRGKSSYNTFRRVSSNSDPSSWIHPGFTAKNLADQVIAKIPGMIDKLTNDFVSMG